jgi:hypothetical protein
MSAADLLVVEEECRTGSVAIKSEPVSDVAQDDMLCVDLASSDSENEMMVSE